MTQKFNPAELDLQEQLVALNRVSKTVKGGRIARFAALMVVGDGNGHVGYGLGKAAEVPEAIRKGIEDAKKNMIEVSLKGSTIPHEVIGVFGAGKVLLSRLRADKEVKQMKKVTLIKSLIGCKPNQKATAKSLGLNKVGDSIVHNDDAVLAGKVKVLSHLVKVENA